MSSSSCRFVNNHGGNGFRRYPCAFCRREFRSAQALGGHMNVHRRDRARLHRSARLRRHSPAPPTPSYTMTCKNLLGIPHRHGQDDDDDGQEDDGDGGDPHPFGRLHLPAMPPSLGLPAQQLLTLNHNSDRRKTGRGCPYPRIGEAIIGERRTAPISTVQKETISTVPSLLQKQGASPWELYREQQTGEVEKNPWLAGAETAERAGAVSVLKLDLELRL